MKIIFEGNHWFPFRSSRPEVFCEKRILKNYTEFRLRSTDLLKKRRFSVNFVKFLKTSFFIEQLRWLLLSFGNIIVRNYFSVVK